MCVPIASTTIHRTLARSVPGGFRTFTRSVPLRPGPYAIRLTDRTLEGVQVPSHS